MKYEVKKPNKEEIVKFSIEEDNNHIILYAEKEHENNLIKCDILSIEKGKLLLHSFVPDLFGFKLNKNKQIEIKDLDNYLYHGFDCYHDVVIN